MRIVREEFGKGNDFVAKITYKTTGAKPEELLAGLPQQLQPAHRRDRRHDRHRHRREADRDACSSCAWCGAANFFEQMKGRGVRIITDSDLQGVTPDATHKDRFVLVDAVGVTETKLIETTPLERKRGVSLEKLLHQVALGSQRGPRLHPRLPPGPHRQPLTPTDRDKLEAVAGAVARARSSTALVEAIDPDRQLAAAQIATGRSEPERRRVEQAASAMFAEARAAARRQPRAARAARRTCSALRPGRSTRSASTRVTRAEFASTPEPARARPSSRSRRSSTSTRTRSPPSRCSTAAPTRSASPSRRQGAGRSHRAATAPLDPRAAVGGLRDPRRIEGPRLGRHRAHQHRLARPLHPRRGRRAGAVPRTGARTLRRLAAPAGDRRPHLHRRAARLARPHPRPPRPPRIEPRDFDPPFSQRGGLGRAASSSARTSTTCSPS